VELVTRTLPEMVMMHNPIQESNRIGYQADYEIIGIYAAPEWEYGVQTFYADTIFVPKASVPHAEQYEDPALPLLNSITILNTSGEAFEAYMEEQGYGGYYQFYDHDYSSNIEGFEAMAMNAERLVLIGFVVLTVTALMFYYLNFRRMVPVARVMRLLGHSRFHVWWQMIGTSLPLILLSVLGGVLLGVYCFDFVANGLLQTEVFLNMDIVQSIAAAEAIIFCIPPLVIAIPISMPGMMNHK